MNSVYDISMLEIHMALSEMEKRILQLRFNTESISNAKKIDYQEYRLSKKQIISKLAEEGHKVSISLDFICIGIYFYNLR